MSNEVRTTADKVRHARAYLAKVESIQGQHGSDACVCACSALFDPDRISFTANEEGDAWQVITEWNRSKNVRPTWDDEKEFGSDSLLKKFNEAMFRYTGDGAEGADHQQNGSRPKVDVDHQTAIIESCSISFDSFCQLKPTDLSAAKIIEVAFPDGYWPENMTEIEFLVARNEWETYKRKNPSSTLPEPVWHPKVGCPFPPILTVGWSVDQFETDRRDRLPWDDLTYLAPSPCRSFVGHRQENDGSLVDHYTAHSKAQIGPRYLMVTEWDENEVTKERHTLAEQVAFGTHLMQFAPLLWVCRSGSDRGDGSLHWAWLCNGIAEEKVSSFFNYACRLGADYRHRLKSQFTRVPNGVNSKTKRRQRCIYFDPSLITGDLAGFDARWKPVPTIEIESGAKEVGATPSPHRNGSSPPPTNPETHGTPAEDRIIILPGGSVSITKCAEKLFRIIGPTQTLFARGGVVVELTNEKGDLQLEVLYPERARSIFEKHGSLHAYRERKGDWVLKHTVCPEQTANALLHTDAARTYLPTITGLLNCPTINYIDGKLHIAGRGYDPNTGFFITGGESPPTVPLIEALNALKSLLAEFDFQTPGDRSRALASLITPALRFGNLLQSYIPIDMAEADDSQSGKTYRQRVVAAVYNEVPKEVTDKEGGVGSVDEAFGNALMKGRPFILFDNFRGHMDSKHLESFLTAERHFSVRLPHSRYMDVDPKSYFIQLSSNGVETTRDLTNRASVVRIRKREGFTFKQYPKGDLLLHVRANQPYFLGCVFAVVTGWIRRGRPKTTETRHDFRLWCQTLDWIVQNIFGEAPLMEGHAAAQQRISSPNLSFVRKLALAIAEDGRLGEELIASNLYEIAQSKGIELPSSRQSILEKAAIQLIGRIMAGVFRVSETIEVDEFKVTRSEEKVFRDDGSGSYDSKSYVFTKATPA